MLSPCFILKASNSTVSTLRHQSVIPNKFSKKTMEAINLGILTKSTRTEVINMIAVQMLQEISYPSLPKVGGDVPSIKGYYWNWLCEYYRTRFSY